MMTFNKQNVCNHHQNLSQQYLLDTLYRHSYILVKSLHQESTINSLVPLTYPTAPASYHTHQAQSV